MTSRRSDIDADGGKDAGGLGLANESITAEVDFETSTRTLVLLTSFKLSVYVLCLTTSCLCPHYFVFRPNIKVDCQEN